MGEAMGRADRLGAMGILAGVFRKPFSHVE